MADNPIRLTKRRAIALLELAGRGLDEEQASIEDDYGVAFNRDGTVDWVDEELITEDEMSALKERLATLDDGRAAMRIVRRRYT